MQTQVNATVLLADDDMSLHLIAREVLNTMNFTLLEATNGVKAISIAGEEQPDVIILDICMPGCDGITVCERLRESPNTRFTPILLISGIRDSAAIEKAYQSGATDLIEKPINWSIFSQRLKLMVKFSRLIYSLQESEQRQKAILRAVPDVLCKITPSGIVSEVFSKLEDNNKFSLKNGLAIGDLYSTKFQHQLQQMIQTVLKDGKVSASEFSLLIEAEKFIQEIRMTKVNDKSILALFRDVTQTYTTQLLNTRLGTALDKSLNEIYVMNADNFQLIQTNKAVNNNLGYDETDVLALNLRDLIQKRVYEFIIDDINSLKAGKFTEVSINTEFNRKDLSTYPVEGKIYYSDDDQTPILMMVVEDVTQKRQAEDKMNYMAYYDSLTGLANRQCFIEFLKHAILLAKRYGHQLAVMFIDLDRFKRVNDTLGHAYGDELLKEFSHRLLASVRESDTVGMPFAASDYGVARIGGDEFVILLEEIKSVNDPIVVADRIISALDAPVELGGQNVTVTPSIGVAIFPNHGESAEQLIKNADIAMYHKKKSGRNGVVVYDTNMSELALERLKIEQALRLAITNNELELYYQPQISFFDEQSISAEALIRWNHPTLGVVSPVDFIPVAEETGLIIPIGHWVINTACQQLKEWINSGVSINKVAVNISCRQLTDENLINIISGALEKYDLIPNQLELELTESVIMDNSRAIQTFFKNLKKLGVGLSIDDFGTGYSSLAYLKQFPLDSVKIDRSFIQEVGFNKKDQNLVNAIFTMAKALNLEVVAEGVETNEQLKALKLMGRGVAQGFLIGKPMSVKVFYEWLCNSSKNGFDVQ